MYLSQISQGLARFYTFWLYLPLLPLALILRYSSRRLRTGLGLRHPPPSDAQEVKLPSVPWDHFLNHKEIVLKNIRKTAGNVSLAELAVLNSLCRTYKPSTIMEIGTFNGRTTLNLALNSNATIFTLDLPRTEKTCYPLGGSNRKYIDKDSSGACFSSPPNHQLPCVRRIIQLYGDSATFDFSPWYGKIDFVFVDGAHSYDYAANDTRIALRLLRPEGGIIVWHDYARSPSVTRALHEFQEKMPALRMVYIKDTTLVVAITKLSRQSSDEGPIKNE